MLSLSLTAASKSLTLASKSLSLASSLSPLPLLLRRWLLKLSPNEGALPGDEARLPSDDPCLEKKWKIPHYNQCTVELLYYWLYM